jgi:cytidylate kinase
MACDIIRDCADELLKSGVPGLVIEGRNTGTFLFPDARLKIWLTASQSARLSRAALDAIGIRPEYLILSELLARDHQDYNRSFAPLARPEKSMEIDTSDFAPEFVGKTIAAVWNALCA